MLTVAIPTMRRWKGFLEKSLPTFLHNDHVSQVVICDETGEDFDAIQKSKWFQHPKLSLYKNEKKLGMYANKRRCIEQSKTEWVAVLDSDNIFPEAFFETLMDTWANKPDPKTVYASSEIIRLFLKTGESEERTKQFAGLKINKENWNTMFTKKGWNFLLNDGNWVAHRSVLDVWPAMDEDKIKATDSIRIVRNFILGGFTYYSVPDLSYIHTVHDDSEWKKTEKESTKIFVTTDWKI